LSFVVRQMTVPDVDAVLQLALTVSEAPQWNRATYVNLLSHGEVQHYAYLAVDRQVVGGFAIASWLPPEEAAELETVAVDARFRRHGLGASLLRACMAAVTRAGASIIRLEVRESNTAAFSLYQRNGFSPSGRRRAYYSAPVEDAILLQAHLGSCELQSPL
jgi:[ribosomal protein S18]-alanine N-acetyltransferase